MKVNLNVGEPLEFSEGIFRTEFTHPLLEGSLYFVHGASNRDQTLNAITSSMADDVNDIFKNINLLIKK